MQPYTVITGATSPLLQPLLHRLHKEGKPLLLIGRDETTLRAKAQNEDKIFVADLRKPLLWRSELQGFLGDTAFAAFVHGAGLHYADAFHQQSADEWQQHFQVHVYAAVTILQLLHPYFQQQKASRVVMVSSIDANKIPRLGPSAAYSSTKAALTGLVHDLAVEWGPMNTTVNAILPGAFAVGNTATMAPEIQDRFVEQIPLGRLGAATELCEAIHFLLSQSASYVTGSSLRVDGGLGLSYS